MTVAKADGRNFRALTKVKAKKVVKEGGFLIGVMGLAHGHIYGMIDGFADAGATVSCVYDPDPEKVSEFISRVGDHVKVCASEDEMIDDPSIGLVINCVVPYERAQMSVRLLQAGKNVFSDKPGFLTVDGYRMIKEARDKSGKHYLIFFSEHFQCEGMIKAISLVNDGAIGDVVHYEGFGPHRLNAPTRPLWFFDKRKNGSVLLDLGCHLVEQFLCLTKTKEASVVYASSVNLRHPQYPDFCDLGEMVLRTKEGTTAYIRVDWFTPDGLSAWGDGRAFITGDEGYIEVRKYLDMGHGGPSTGDRVYISDMETERMIDARDNVGFEFFGSFILDCLNGTFDATDYDLSLEAMRITVEAEQVALRQS